MTLLNYVHYDWPVDDIPSASVYGDDFTVDHSMICKLGATVLLISVTTSWESDLESELLSTVCNEVETKPVLQDFSGERLSRGSNKAEEAILDIQARGFWEEH